ncbi:MAG: hypothetical protein ACYTXC_08670 [Nostoc sp.]
MPAKVHAFFHALVRRIKYHSLHYHGIFYVASLAHNFPTLLLLLHGNIKDIFLCKGEYFETKTSHWLVDLLLCWEDKRYGVGKKHPNLQLSCGAELCRLFLFV